MGSRSDNGDNAGNWPGDSGSPDGLPDLPAEWGVIVIPNDLSELSEEVTAIRDELRREQRTTRWHRFFDRPGLRTLRRLGAASLRAPVLIISLAILVTVASLFASAWPGPARSPATQRTASSTDESTTTLPALELKAADGRIVPLRGELPAVVLLTDGCDCATLIADTTAAVRPGITVVTVRSGKAPQTATEQTPPTSNTPQAQGKMVRELHDPTGELRSTLKLSAPDGTAAVLLVNRAGDVVRMIPRVALAKEFQPDLARL
ncbi:hypothetical protein [Actinoplanes sp. TFC3]|uniref:hypothetical protein n=1 Tax=Actinoplanes sp. TFC3 TaxID=1710355 RepID=UPI00083389E9|nr:hypothetical protein [Actinoplanes sp. TFC3]